MSPTDARNQLNTVPDFQEISKDESDRLIDWLIQDNALIQVSGLLVLGPTAQCRFGRKNFMELYAVLSSPQSYSVHTATDQPLGTLGQDFVDGLVEHVSCFLLDPQDSELHWWTFAGGKTNLGAAKFRP